MSDQNNSNQDNSSTQQNTNSLVPDYLNTQQTNNTTSSDSNFFSPGGDSSSKKKFGKGKIIATFLGVLLLIAGITTGIILVLQPQLLQQQAAVTNYCGASDCDSPGFSCSQDNGSCKGTKPDCSCVYSGTGCFLPGTKIQTPGGDKNIEDIVNGDSVYSFNDSTNKINSSLVSNLYEVTRDHYYKISSFSTKVSVTAEHPFYVGNGNYVEASKLRIGNIVFLLKDGKMVKSLITSIIRVNEPTKAYNLTVDGDHTFFANNYSVHNKTLPAYCAIELTYCSPTTNFTNGVKCVRGGVFNSCCPSGYTNNGSGTCVFTPVGNCAPSTAGTQGVCSPGYLCSASGKCAQQIGVGNCKNNTGNCFVDTAIGLVDNHNGTYGAICDAGGHWTTCSPGYNCSLNALNLRDCVPGTVPNPTSPPSSIPPSNPPTPTRSPSPRPTPTRSPSPTPTRSPSPRPTPTRSPSPRPTPTRSPSPRPTPTRSPSPTPTRSPSPTPVPQCNSTCTTTSQCPTGLTCSSGFCRNPNCTSQSTCVCPTATPTPVPSPTPGPTAICSSLKAYDTSWTLLSSNDLAGLRAGNNIEFCVAGTTTGESFDMARFTINDSLQADTTNKRPNSNDFCQSYTIPEGTYTFTVTAQIHHTSLGWVGP